MLKKFLLAFLSIVLLSNTSFACSCDKKEDVDNSLKNSTLVFVGQVKTKGLHPFKKNEAEIKFVVNKKIKGFEEVNGNTVTVYTPVDFEYCGYRFGTGLDYLVYATGTPAHFYTTSCSRTEILEKSQSEIQKLLRSTAGK